MKTNIEEHLSWLSLNPPEIAYTSGFDYANTASKNVQRPANYNFTTTKDKQAKSSSIASVSVLGVIDLDMYRRKSVSPVENVPQTSSSSSTSFNKINNNNTSNNLASRTATTVQTNTFNSAVTSHATISDEDFLNCDFDGSYLLLICIHSCLLRMTTCFVFCLSIAAY